MDTCFIFYLLFCATVIICFRKTSLEEYETGPRAIFKIGGLLQSVMNITRDHNVYSGLVKKNFQSLIFKSHNFKLSKMCYIAIVKKIDCFTACSPRLPMVRLQQFSQLV